MSLANFKSQFATGGELIHLNNAGRALIPLRTRDLMKNWLDRFYTDGTHFDTDLFKATYDTREELANFAGCSASQVVFYPNTAAAISQVALGTAFKSGDEIIVWDQEYPANFYPWHVAAERTGAKLVIAKSDHWQTPVSRILDCITPRTRAIAISWVQFQTGSVTDLQELASAVRGRNILLLADVIQGLGVKTFNFLESGFDFVVGNCQKWLLTPMSLGFLIGKPESFEKLAPLMIGAKTFDAPDTQPSVAAPWQTGTMKFEPSFLPALISIGFGESLRLLRETGIGVIEAEAQRLTQVLRDNLKSAGFDPVPSQSSIVSFGAKNPAHLAEVEEHLKKKKVSYGKRGPGIRLSVHAYNLDSDVKIF